MPAPSRPAPNHPETPLSRLIRTRIGETGPITVATFMDLALHHPVHGYYQSQDPFGGTGDFITAPEVSQTFGELIGLWLATAWQQSGAPPSFRLVELGPGRGQLMADLIRATAKLSGFLGGADIHFVETSRRLREEQRRRLPEVGITWHDGLETVPPGPLFLIANEVFDALPVHQLIRTPTGWAERLITWDDHGQSFAFTEGPAPDELVAMLPLGPPPEPGGIAEVSPLRSTLARHVAARIERDSGLGIIIDYGAWVDRVTGDTLQAVRRHGPADPLSTPGKADLTTHVDFRSLGEAADEAGALVFGPVPQGPFLRTLGIEARTAALLQHADDDQRRSLRHGLFRLTDASAMGELFKVLVIASPDSPPPPGFSAPTRGDPAP